jgi:hypothetical protein
MLTSILDGLDDFDIFDICICSFGGDGGWYLEFSVGESVFKSFSDCLFSRLVGFICFW